MMNNNMIRFLTPLLSERNGTFHQLIESWTCFHFSFDLLLQLLHHHSHSISASLCSALSSLLFLLLQAFSSPLALPLGAKRFSAESHPFPLSRLRQCSDWDPAGLAWFGSVGLQQAALRHRTIGMCLRPPLPKRYD